METTRKLSLKQPESQVDLDGVIYTVRGVTGKERDTYQSFLLSKARLGPDGKVQGYRDAKGIQSHLLSLSLHGPDGQRVTQATIDEWPATTVEVLFEIAADLCGLTNASAESLGNGSQASV